MKLENIVKNLPILDSLNVSLPDYYHYLPDEVVLTPKDIAGVLGVTEKTVRYWFNPGLNHGRLLSTHPIKNCIYGKNLKEWFWKRDYPKLMLDKDFLKAMVLISSKEE